MNWIAVQSYYKVEREITGLEQKTVVQDRLMHLYEDKLVTRYREFPIGEVFDISYRPLGGSGEGLLYLHTKQGLFSYTVGKHPAPFIEAYKQLVNQLSDE
ncbi:hypothetical protein [Paenibacillus harenae]|uniref:hypothetical protein n=1 Tax=Paenibacillus harenae TaxID=306543 RepID=UPI000423AFE8|nr:hypothetical protein [Paenibacillus harenae]